MNAQADAESSHISSCSDSESMNAQADGESRHLLDTKTPWTPLARGGVHLQVETASLAPPSGWPIPGGPLKECGP